MGQKVNPVGLRIGINQPWSSDWCNDKSQYSEWLHQDIKIRKILFKELAKAAVSKIDIQRNKQEIIVFIKTARPGAVLGSEGKNIKQLKILIQKALKNRNLKIKINTVEIQNPDLDAYLVAKSIAERIVNRAPFRTAQKLAIKRCLKAGAKGIKTSISGRLGGVDMARTEGYLEGRMPLATLRSNIDYALAEALTTYGQIGVKVWIYKGEIYKQDFLNQPQTEKKDDHRRKNNLKNFSTKPKSNFKQGVKNVSTKKDEVS